MNLSTPINSAIVLVASFLIVVSSVIGLIVLALTHDDVIQIVIPILAGVIAGFVSAFTAVISHYIGGIQEQQRMLLRFGTEETK